MNTHELLEQYLAHSKNLVSIGCTVFVVIVVRNYNKVCTLKS